MKSWINRDVSITRIALLVLLFVLTTVMRDYAEADKPAPFIPGDGVALLHQEFQLRCDNLDFSPHRGNLSYLWFRNSTLINHHSSHVLLFPNVTEADQGNYTCAVRDTETGITSLQSSPATLRAYSSNIPRPHIHPVGTAVVSQSFILICDMADSYTSSRDVTFAWYKEGTQVLVQFTPVRYFSALREEDGGVYTCAVKDGGHTSPPSEAFSLTPLVSPEIHIGLKILHNVIKGILGENLTLTCEVTRAFPEVPADGYSWSYLPSPQGPRLPLAGKASTLTLGPLTREDAGHYVCQARNQQHFQGHSLIGSNASVTVRITYLDNITLTPDLRVTEGDRVTLNCSVDSQPAARLAWIVHGQEVRHVTDNLDHYVIPRAGCSDSTSYTCRASNTDMPGREMSASTRLHVLPCITAPATSDNSAAEVSATFDFRLPDTTSLVVVVHPGGQDMVTVQQDCSFTISSAFLPRLLLPRCDPAQRVLTFTLTKVTEEDEGNYTCREDRPSGKLIPSCRTMLQVKGVDSSQGVSPAWRTALIVVLCILALFLVILVVIWQRRRLAKCPRCVQRRLVSKATCETEEVDLLNIKRPLVEATCETEEVDLSKKRRPLVDDTCETEDIDLSKSNPVLEDTCETEDIDLSKSRPVLETAGNKDATCGTLHDVQIEMQAEHLTSIPTDALPEGEREDFEALYKRGKVYVIPPLPPQQLPLAGGQADLDILGQEEAKVCVLRLLCDLLEAHARPDDPPVFVFTQTLSHHTHAVIYHSRWGVIIVKTEVVSKSVSSLTLTEEELRKAARQLGEARQKVEEELRGLLAPEAVTLLLALPNLENRGELGDSVQEQLNDQDIHLLCGRKADLDTRSQLPFTWERRPMWSEVNKYPAFVTAVSRHLCLESYSQTEGGHTSVLATPEQAAVLRCTDKLLHIWGPPSSGKTLLVLDRTRRWLRRGKRMVVAVCSSDCQLLLHRLGRESLYQLTSDTASRLTLCCKPGELRKTLQKLGQQRPPSSICIIIDNVDCQIYSVLLEASRSALVECVWTTGQRDLPAQVSDQLQSLGGRSVLLPHPLRCHPDLLPLARELLPPGALTPDLTDPPCLPARLPPASVKVTLHPFHPDYRALEQVSSAFDCKACSQWLRSSLSPLMKRLPLEDERWRHWVILLTGDWGSGSRVMRRQLVTWLRQQGVPAVQEWKPEHRVSRLPASSLMDPSRDQGSEVSKDRATLRARVLSGEDREGRPAVHVIPVSHFTGLEKARVLAVHYDWRDDHPHHQSQEKEDARLSRHRDQLFHAVTRCQTELAVWLLSPSPAASLLQGHEVEAAVVCSNVQQQQWQKRHKRRQQHKQRQQHHHQQ